jgi:hypothetical protein
MNKLQKITKTLTSITILGISDHIQNKKGKWSSAQENFERVLLIKIKNKSLISQLQISYTQNSELQDIIKINSEIVLWNFSKMI